MKRSLFVLAVLLLSFGLANANVGFRVEFAPTWDNGGTPTVSPGQNFTIELYMANDDNQRNGFSLPLEFSGTGDVATVTWVDAGVPAPEGGYMGGAMEILNGFAPGFYAGVRFTALNQITADYDGNLPDSMNHTTAQAGPGAPGWPPLTPELLVYRWHLNIGGTWAADVNSGTICIDSIAYRVPTLNWLWAPASGPFGGPYCAPVAVAPNLPPALVSGCPATDVVLQWDAQVSKTLTYSDPDGDPLAVTSANVGSFDIDNATQATWTFNPDCGDVGSYDVALCAGDAMNGCPGANICEFTVTVLNTAPNFTVCPTAVLPVSAFGSATTNVAATDANVGDVLVFSSPTTGVTVSPAGLVTIDGTQFGVGQQFATIVVTDCNGDTDECVIELDVVVELPYDIVIEKVEDQLQGHYATVDVIKTKGTNDMYGFDFLIAYDASALTAMGVIPGVLFNDEGAYRWEYFTYRFGPFGNCGSACPSGYLRVVAIAEQNDGPIHPLEFNVPDDMVLFQLSFLVSNDRTFECQYVPIRFWWMDCGDNTIAYHPSSSADPLEILTAVSKTVNAFQAIGTYYDITDDETGYPTFTGYQGEDACPPEPNKPGALEFINFFNGGIDIICAEDIDARGDINLNGIANEIADAVVFTNYFIYGLPAFTVNFEGQMAASDVNADGIVLSVADLVYLIRVIVGDALPYPKLAAGNANFTIENGMLTTDVELGAALFIFDGNVSVSAAGSFEVKTGYVDGQTRVLVYDMDRGEAISGQILNTSELPVSVEAVDYNGAVYNAAIVPSTFSLTNYPNPFNPVTTIQMNIPSVNEVDFTIEVFNVAGQKVSEFSGHGAGMVTVEWDASDVASGIYFYRGTANGVSATEKMVLLK